MTRPGHVLIEPTAEEAEALLSVLYRVPDREIGTKARVAIVRLEQALRVERGPGGSAEPVSLAERVQSLIGQDVQVSTAYGERTGRLLEVRDTCSLVLDIGELRLKRTISLAAVTDICAAEPERAAA